MRSQIKGFAIINKTEHAIQTDHWPSEPIALLPLNTQHSANSLTIQLTHVSPDPTDPVIHICLT